ncbi:MAG: hypothetical protein M3O30_12195 [Planctomycetota bacterium]|nr:hypothetical protein [Planctomycetota bacterium]
MFGRSILVLAAVLYLSVIGCVVLGGSSSQSEAAKTTEPVNNLVSVAGLHPFCGIAMQLQRVDWVEEYKKTIDRIAAEGADTVSLVVDARQENGLSTRMYVDMRLTMTVPQLTEIINHAKEKKLRVILMPIVLLDSPIHDEWRGTLEPRDWAEWFTAYREMISHYARIAQATNVDVLVVGSELVSSEEHYDEWIETIRGVRDIYKGQLTYSSNWDRYQKVKFWKYLDFIGMNSYWTLGKDSNATVDQIKESWKKIQDKMLPFLEEQHKPVILLEAGWCSLANAAKDPWDYTQVELNADTDLQRRLYEGFFQSWWGKPQLAGFMIWEMCPNGDPTGKAYSPEGKPAEMVMRDWLAKPRWDIMGNASDAAK